MDDVFPALFLLSMLFDVAFVFADFDVSFNVSAGILIFRLFAHLCPLVS